MADIKGTFVSTDTEEIQIRRLSGKLLISDLYKPNGWITQKVKYPNSKHSNEYRIASLEYLGRTLAHSHYTGSSKRYNPYTEQTYYVDAVALFEIAGMCRHRTNSDRAKRQFRDLLLEFTNSHDCKNRFKRIDVAHDVELSDINDFDIDNFFLLQLSKSQSVISPFEYFVGEDGSRTYYKLPLKDPKAKKQDRKRDYVPKKRYYMYLKHVKEGLRDRFILRFEASYTNLDRFGGDADELIKYMETDLNSIRLFCFDNVETGNDYKRLYEARIPKKGIDNVTPTLLRKIKSKADNEFEIGLPEDIKAHIRNVLNWEKPKPANNPNAFNVLFGYGAWRKAQQPIWWKNRWEKPKHVEPTDQEEPEQVDVEPTQKKGIKFDKKKLKRLSSRLSKIAAECGV